MWSSFTALRAAVACLWSRGLACDGSCRGWIALLPVSQVGAAVEGWIRSVQAALGAGIKRWIVKQALFVEKRFVEDAVDGPLNPSLVEDSWRREEGQLLLLIILRHL